MAHAKKTCFFWYKSGVLQQVEVVLPVINTDGAVGSKYIRNPRRNVCKASRVGERRKPQQLSTWRIVAISKQARVMRIQGEQKQICILLT